MSGFQTVNYKKWLTKLLLEEFLHLFLVFDASVDCNSSFSFLARTLFGRFGLFYMRRCGRSFSFSRSGCGRVKKNRDRRGDHTRRLYTKTDHKNLLHFFQGIPKEKLTQPEVIFSRVSQLPHECSKETFICSLHFNLSLYI